MDPLSRYKFYQTFLMQQQYFNYSCKLKLNISFNITFIKSVILVKLIGVNNI